MTVTKIEIEKNADSSKYSEVRLITTDGTVFKFNAWIASGYCGFYEEKGTRNRGIRPNKIDSKVFNCLKDFSNYTPPSHRKIAEIVGCHPSYIGKSLRNLQAKGLIGIDLKIAFPQKEG